MVTAGPLIQDPVGAATEILPTPPSNRYYAAVLEFSANRVLTALYLATGANIRMTSYRHDGLVIALAPGGALTLAGSIVVPAPASDVPLTFAQLSGEPVATITPFRLGSPPATSLTATFAFEPGGFGIAMAGSAANGVAYVSDRPTWSMNEDRLQYIVYLNSRNGIMCGER